MIMLKEIIEGLELALECQLDLDYQYRLPALKYDFPDRTAEWYRATARRLSFGSNEKVWNLSFALIQAYALVSDNRTNSDVI
jgi:hypothetical protein